MQVADDSGWRHFYVSLQFLRLPLFTVISGYVYALRPLERSSVGPFLWRKVQRLLIPMITVGTAFFVLQNVTPGTNTRSSFANIWEIYALPHAHFWYLQALMLVFLAVAALESGRLMRRATAWTACWLGSIAVVLLVPLSVNAFSLRGFLYLLPFFLFGIGLCRFPGIVRARRSVVLATGLLIGGVVYQQLCWYGVVSDHPAPRSLPGMAVGLSATFLLFRFRPTARPLVVLGGYAYGIYLLHVFGTAGSRILLARLGVHHPAAVFAAGVTLGSLVPIGIEWATSGSSWARFLLFGHKLRRAPRPALARASSPR